MSKFVLDKNPVLNLSCIQINNEERKLKDKIATACPLEEMFFWIDKKLWSFANNSLLTWKNINIISERGLKKQHSYQLFVKFIRYGSHLSCFPINSRTEKSFPHGSSILVSGSYNLICCHKIRYWLKDRAIFLDIY